MRRIDPATVTSMRELRAAGRSLKDIAAHVGVAPSTVHVWTRDIPVPSRELRRPAVRRSPGKLHAAKLADIAAADVWARERLATLSDDAFFAAGIALYIGEGHKRDGTVAFTNTNPAVVAFFLSWLRQSLTIDERRLRAVLYLHEGLDLAQATSEWSAPTGIPADRFGKPYRAVPRARIRTAKHVNGCLTVRYSCSRTHRRIMALCELLLSSTTADPA